MSLDTLTAVTAATPQLLRKFQIGYSYSSPTNSKRVMFNRVECCFPVDGTDFLYVNSTSTFLADRYTIRWYWDDNKPWKCSNLRERFPITVGGRLHSSHNIKFKGMKVEMEKRDT